MTSAVGRRPARPVARCLVAAIDFYRRAISPLRPPVCRYSPSCSEYALTAIERFGAARGSWLALRRLLRCHPFHAGGHDPVPPLVGRDDSPAVDSRDGRTARRTALTVVHPSGAEE